MSGPIFTELIMAFVKSEALVRSQGAADNWPVMDCQKHTGGFFLSAVNTF